MLDILPAIVKHLPIGALGCLRRTSRLFRRLPCILAIPSSASDVHEKWGGTDFEEPHILSFLQALPNLKDLEVKRAYSLVGLGHLQPLERLTIYAHGHMDLRPLRRLKSLRHLHWQCRAQVESACLHELTQLTSLVYNTAREVDVSDICSLSNLQALGLMTLVESAVDLAALTALTSLSMFEQDLNMELTERDFLRCLYIRIHTVEGFLDAHMDTLLQLTAIAALTLDFSEASQQEVDLNDLQHLPNLQELCVRNCDSISQLRLYALTAFTFWSKLWWQALFASIGHLFPAASHLCVFGLWDSLFGVTQQLVWSQCRSPPICQICDCAADAGQHYSVSRSAGWVPTARWLAPD